MHDVVTFIATLIVAKLTLKANISLSVFTLLQKDLQVVVQTLTIHAANFQNPRGVASWDQPISIAVSTILRISPKRFKSASRVVATGAETAAYKFAIAFLNQLISLYITTDLNQHQFPGKFPRSLSHDDKDS